VKVVLSNGLSNSAEATADGTAQAPALKPAAVAITVSLRTANSLSITFTKAADTTYKCTY